MKFALKVIVIAVLLAAMFAVAFAIWGERFETLFSQERCIEWFSEIRGVAWLIGIGLLLSDLLLPIPATGVMAALGAVYGVPLGAAVGTAGSVLAALTGYGLARLAGERAIRRIADPSEVERFRLFFDRWGGAGIIVSRILPILPEVMSVLAGLAPMRFGRFLIALLLGTVPTAILFAWVGAASAAQPWYGMAIAVVLPLVLWPGFLWVIRRSDANVAPESSDSAGTI